MYKKSIENIILMVLFILVILISVLSYFQLVKNDTLKNYFLEKKESFVSDTYDRGVCWINDIPNLKIPDIFTIDNKKIIIKKIQVDNVSKFLSGYNSLTGNYQTSDIRYCNYIIITTNNNIASFYPFIYSQANLGKEIIVYSPIDINKKVLQDEFCLDDIQEVYEGEALATYGAFVTKSNNGYKLLTDELNGYQHVVYFLKGTTCYNYELNDADGLCIPPIGYVTPRKIVDEEGNVYWDLYKYGSEIFLQEFGQYYYVYKNYVSRGYFSKIDSEKIYSMKWNVLDSRCSLIHKRVLFKIKPIDNDDNDYPYVLEYSYGLGDIFLILSSNPERMIVISKYIVRDY